MLVPLPGAVFRPVVGAPTRPAVGRPEVVILVRLAPVFGRAPRRIVEQPHPEGRGDDPLLVIRPQKDLEVKRPAVKIVRRGNG